MTITVPKSRTRFRKAKERAFFYVVCGFSLLTAVPLLLIIWEVVRKGYRQISLSFFTENAPSTLDAMLAKTAGESIPGGIANGILGTLSMTLIAALIAIPSGILAGVYLSEKRKTAFAGIVRFLTELLQGTPSIVIGIIAVFKQQRAASGIMLPLIVRSTEETLNMLPSPLKEAGLALGAPYRSVVMRILVPSAFGGMFTGILLAVSRAMGETAPLMLTALGCATLNFDPLHPTSAVPLLIWEFYNDPNLVDLIWGCSLLLLILTLVLNIIAKRIAAKWKI